MLYLYVYNSHMGSHKHMYDISHMNGQYTFVKQLMLRMLQSQKFKTVRLTITHTTM